MRPVCGPPACSEQITTLKYNPSSLLLTTSILKESYVKKINSPRNSPQGEGYSSFFAVFLHQEGNKLSDWSFSALKCTTMPATAAETERSLLRICCHVSSSLITPCLCCTSLVVWFISHFNYFWSQHFHFGDQWKTQIWDCHISEFYFKICHYCSCVDKVQLKRIFQILICNYNITQLHNAFLQYWQYWKINNHSLKFSDFFLKSNQRLQFCTV